MGPVLKKIKKNKKIKIKREGNGERGRNRERERERKQFFLFIFLLSLFSLIYGNQTVGIRRGKNEKALLDEGYA